MKSLVNFVALKIRTNPVVAWSLVAAAAQAVITYVNGGGALTWAALVTVVGGAVSRQFVFPTNGLTASHADHSAYVAPPSGPVTIDAPQAG